MLHQHTEIRIYQREPRTLLIYQIMNNKIHHILSNINERPQVEVQLKQTKLSVLFVKHLSLV